MWGGIVAQSQHSLITVPALEPASTYRRTPLHFLSSWQKVLFSLSDLDQHSSDASGNFHMSQLQCVSSINSQVSPIRIFKDKVLCWVQDGQAFIRSRSQVTLSINMPCIGNVSGLAFLSSVPQCLPCHKFLTNHQSLDTVSCLSRPAAIHWYHM